MCKLSIVSTKSSEEDGFGTGRTFSSSNHCFKLNREGNLCQEVNGLDRLLECANGEAHGPHTMDDKAFETYSSEAWPLDYHLEWPL